MQKIQIITHDGNEWEYIGINNVIVSKLKSPMAFDDFGINIIDLNDENIWRNEQDGYKSVESLNDFHTIKRIIKGSLKSKIIIVLPGDIRFENNYIEAYGDYNNFEELKNLIPEMIDIMTHLSETFKEINLVFERTVTKVMDKEISADFRFSNPLSEEVLTKSKLSEKTTTIKKENIILTTLNLSNFEKIKAFLDEIGLGDKKDAVPEWMEEVQMFDDDRQHEIIDEKMAMIAEQEKEIAKAEAVLEQNRRYKSILYTQSNELVDVVFEILNEMVGFDFSNFVDERKEDFRCEKEGYVFIGEIKGVTSNIKNEHVSQLDVHCQKYIDSNPDKKDKIKSILIMNYQRNRPVSERDEVHEDQIKLAERNRSLIIDTFTLLKMFEKFKRKELDQDACFKMLIDNKGHLVM